VDVHEVVRVLVVPVLVVVHELEEEPELAEDLEDEADLDVEDSLEQAIEHNQKLELVDMRQDKHSVNMPAVLDNQLVEPYIHFEVDIQVDCDN